MNAYLLREKAEAWIRDDVDPACQNELRAILDHYRDDELHARFAESLAFGTAGLRGVMGAGPNRMNRAVVIRTTWAVAQYLIATKGLGGQEIGIVIGYDGRVQSRTFAEDAAEVALAAGHRVFLFSDVVPTPVTAYAVTHLNAMAGIVVTASHNPREYNGYKLYGESGAQIIPPVDAAIATMIDEAPAARAIARASLDEGRARGLLVDVGADIERAYLRAIGRPGAEHRGGGEVSIVYTAMHGVGEKVALQALSNAGFERVESVPEQAKPDGSFPTVAFPNPEEEGALDLALACASKTHASLVLANDPDADRLAVAVPSQNDPRHYVRLTGNQVGVLLGNYVLAKSSDPAGSFMLASCVSSPMLRDIARAQGCHYEETLTGFKWIASRAIELEKQTRKTFLFGYEEALGYAVGSMVRDKDGISAAVVFAQMVAELKGRGETIFDVLESLYRAYGLYASCQVSITRSGSAGAAILRDAMNRLREGAVERIGGLRVAAVCDFERRTRRVIATSEQFELPFPASDVLSYELENGCRVIARPSGTEPKIKLYIDVREPMHSNEPLSNADARAQASLAALRDAFTSLVAIPQSG